MLRRFRCDILVAAPSPEYKTRFSDWNESVREIDATTRDAYSAQ